MTLRVASPRSCVYLAVTPAVLILAKPLMLSLVVNGPLAVRPVALQPLQVPYTFMLEGRNSSTPVAELKYVGRCSHEPACTSSRENRPVTSSCASAGSLKSSSPRNAQSLPFSASAAPPATLWNNGS